MVSLVFLKSRNMLVPVFFVCACLLTTGHVQAEVSPEEAKKRAALEHLKEKLRKQNEEKTQPASEEMPKPKANPKMV